MPASRFKDRFSAVAGAYSRHRPTYPSGLATVLAENAPGLELAVDCGCGSGQLTVLLAGRFERVVGVDPSAAQLAEATRHAGVEYRVAPAEDTGLWPGTADLVVAAQAAHWFHLPAFWREAERIGKPEVLVAIVGYGLPRIDPEVDQVLYRFHNQVVGPYWDQERWLVVGGYRALEFPFRERPSPSLQMTANWSLDDLAGYISTWSGLVAAERALGRPLLPEVLPRLAAAWGEPDRPKAVSWPLTVRMGSPREER